VNCRNGPRIASATAPRWLAVMPERPSRALEGYSARRRSRRPQAGAHWVSRRSAGDRDAARLAHLLVAGLGALKGGARHEPLDVGGEGRPRLEKPEGGEVPHRAAEDHAGHRERLTEKERSSGERALHRLEHRLVAAPARAAFAERPALLLGHDAGLDDRRREARPPKVGAARRMIEGRSQAPRRVAISEVQADGAGLRDDRVTVGEDRQLPHRIEREDLGRLLLAREDVDERELVVDADLLEHPDGTRGAREGVV